MFFGVWDFIFQSSSFWDFPLVAFTCAAQTSTGASRRANRGCLRLGWCCFPTPPSDQPQIVAQGRVLFVPQNERTHPPKGGGAGFRSSLGFRVLLGSCLWQPLATTGSHGPNRAGLLLQWRRSPTWLSKSHTVPHRAEFGFTAFSWCASFAEVPLAGAPDGNSPPLGWAGW